MTIRIPRGTADILPGEVEKWHYIENKIRDLCRRFNYAEIRTPIFEHTELFQRGVGETTDIVEKEMYTFIDKGDRSITLRPEGTAAVVRAYVEHKLYADPKQPVKLYYIGPMFRYERPQAGRMRQFTQFGIEAIGSKDPLLDAEVIAMAMQFYAELGLTGLRLELNSVGCQNCRPKHREALVAFLEEVKEELGPEDRSRLERNPLRVLDSKDPKTQELTKNAPSILDYLCEDCRPHFEAVQRYLDELNIPYVINPRLVRGLDYYTQTAFEIMVEGIGAIGTICGGGRYNGLVAEIGGQDKPGIGFALSIERLLLALEKQGIELPVTDGLDCFVVTLGEAAKRQGFKLVHQWRKAGLKVEQDFLDRGLKGQLKSADRYQAKYAAIVGEDELAKGVVVLKNLATGEQQEYAYAEAEAFLLKQREQGVGV
ncbi:Histidyl-tRNA synthetase [Caldalkalibacillus thermarum TA2.A1]|uniref:Histidine--tRNA ligase n=1 Tax=Caldalkalibacillus thermarum (strain TA2.A1) TaxID=986075 RepID=F5LAS0_CALTT|nr:histidine--tRNA ligase [Caldalkalibacillus thermarum]EGL81642.1 Histidyl-tRNA synthetase [Caldalkalibacillus thermarum TA2.A1]